MPSGTPSIFERRARDLLTDAREEVSRLVESKNALMAEREERLGQVRAEYAERIGDIDAELRTIGRLEKALDPDAPRPGGARKKKKEDAPKVRTRPWTPSEEQRDRVLAAMRDGLESVADIQHAMGVSRTTVGYAIEALREDGFVRLASTGTGNGPSIFRLTKEGQTRAASVNGVAV